MGKKENIFYKEKTGKDLNVYNDDTENLDALQTAIFVSSYAMYKLYEKKGIIPDIVMGHSLGEITAYAAAGNYFHLMTVLIFVLSVHSC